MSSDPPASDASRSRSPAPLAPAVRQRLQKVFEHGRRCVEKGDHDYANQLLSQCVAEDPANLIYLQSFLANLQKKYGDNKKGARFSGLKIKSHRSTLAKAAGKGDWEAAFQAGCAALSLNPWDTTTLLAMAKACEELGIDECQLFYLRWAMGFDAKDPVVNRQAALALERMGQFDQAIACWQRVGQAKPGDEEATRAISQLSVEKTIKQGGYDPASLSGGSAKDGPSMSVARLSKGGDQGTIDRQEKTQPPEQRLTEAIKNDPAEINNYLQLADLLLHEQRFDEADQVLTRAMQASGGGDLQVRERLEEVLLRRTRHQLAIAEHRAGENSTDQSQELAAKLRAQTNQVELEVFAARADRDPQNPRLQYELGLRFKRAGKFKEAIPPLQAARSDSKRKPLVLLDLGECFQKIEQYKLALSHYEQAIEAAEEPASDTRKLALYRAGVLSTGLRELDRAERHLSELAGIDFSYRDVADRLDNLAQLRDSE